MKQTESQYIPPRFTEKEIISIVERVLPDFANSCKSKAADQIMITQAAFASDYLMGEFTLLAFAVKYAGLKNKTLIIIPHKTKDEKN